MTRHLIATVFLGLNIITSVAYSSEDSDSLYLQSSLDEIKIQLYKNPESTLTKIDSVLNSSDFLDLEHIEANLMMQKGLALKKLTRDSVLFWFQRAAIKAIVLEDKKLYFTILRNEATFYKNQGSFNPADSVFQIIINDRFFEKDSIALIPHYLQYSMLLKDMAIHKTAMEFLQKGLDLSLKYKNDKYLLHIYSLLASLSFTHNDYEIAIPYIRHALRYLDQNDQRRFSLYNNLGLAFSNIEQKDSAIYYFKRVLNSQTLNSSRVYTLYGLSKLMFEENQYKDSRQYADQCIDLAQKFKNEALECNCRLIDAISIAELGDHELAVNCFTGIESCLKKYEKVENLIPYKQYNLSSKLHLLGLPRLAKDLDDISDLQDSIQEVKSLEVLRDVETKYKAEKKELENKILLSENYAKQAIIGKQRAILTGSTFSLLALLFGLYFLIQRNQKEKELHEKSLNDLKADNVRWRSKVLQAKEARKQIIIETGDSLYLKEYNSHLSINEIQFVQSDGNYLKIYTKSNPKGLLIRHTLSKLLSEYLPEIPFSRINQRTIINMNFINESNSKHVILDIDGLHRKFNIGRAFKQKFTKSFNEMSELVS